jgi:regulator of protease activity HflC (stomatin/prohibitin superfamily)
MSGGFIFVLLCLAVAVIALLCVIGGKGDTVSIAGVVAVAALVVGLITCGFSSATIIPTRSVGVVVEVGKPTGTVSNGFHWVKPWAHVEKFDTSLQTLKLDGDGKGDSTPCVRVRLGNQTTACVDVSVQWHIDPNGDVVDLYRKFKSPENVETNLVRRQLREALNLAFDTYDPLASVNGTADKAVSREELATKARLTLASSVGTGIKVGDLLIPMVHFDSETENRLKAYQQAIADTRIAQQRTLTAEETRRANDILAKSTAGQNEGVMYQNCLDFLRSLAAADKLKDLPPTFNCGSAGNNLVLQGRS